MAAILKYSRDINTYRIQLQHVYGGGHSLLFYVHHDLWSYFVFMLRACLGSHIIAIPYIMVENWSNILTLAFTNLYAPLVGK